MVWSCQAVALGALEEEGVDVQNRGTPSGLCRKVEGWVSTRGTVCVCVRAHCAPTFRVLTASDSVAA